MAKKNNPLTCPYCLTKLLEVTGHCVGVIVKCHHCGASVPADGSKNYGQADMKI